jgi:hypothetical protein
MTLRPLINPSKPCLATIFEGLAQGRVKANGLEAQGAQCDVAESE